MILIGTSGWSYNEWCGPWYPPDLPKRKMLEYYATVFDAVEINATYYRVPGRNSAEGMVRAAQNRLSFAIKAPGDLTHSPSPPESTLLAYRHFLEPFQEATCLGAVLLQFPQRFHYHSQNLRYLERLARQLPDLPLVAEFRHNSWDTPQVETHLDDLAISRAAVDQPNLRGLSEAGTTFQAGRIAYVRFHGRNSKAWHLNDDSSARYQYQYRTEELTEWLPSLKEMDKKSATTYAFFNNHPDGSAPRNAEEMATLLGITLRGTGYRDMFSP